MLKHLNNFLLTVIILFTACRTQPDHYRLYKMEDFNLDAGNEFVQRIYHLPEVKHISVIDEVRDGNHFKVNRQSISADTIQDMPNYYSYRKHAKELNVDPDSLLGCIKAFDKMQVMEFSRDSLYFRFQVVVGFTTERGYIYAESPNLSTGDTLPAVSVKNLDHRFRVVLEKQLRQGWFEYYELVGN